MGAQPQLVGQVLGHYLVLEQIGAGGMGIVYRAHDQMLDRDVAIKLLPATTLAPEADRKQFRKEAITLARLNHPNIATIHEFGTHNGADFLVTEYIPGITLDAKLAAGPLDEEQTLTFAIQLAEGLTAAHREGVIHRDLKPGNLRIRTDGTLKILDFGLAQLMPHASKSGLTATVTQSQELTGTLPYMSPEQLRGETPGACSDIWSACAVIYEMASGKRPFPESNPAQLINAILNREPSHPRKLGSRISPELENLILKGLSKDGHKRYQSAEELAAALRSVAGFDAPLYGRYRRAHWKLAAGITVAVLILMAFVLRTPVRHRFSALFSAPKDRHLAVVPFQASAATPEDQAFVNGLTDTFTARLMQLPAVEPMEIVSAGEIHALHITSTEDARKQLGVNATIEGRVERAADRVQVNLTLVDANSSRRIKSATISAGNSDPLALEDQVVQAAINMLGIKLREDQKNRAVAPSAVNAAAYSAYTRARGFLIDHENPEDIDSAINQFARALSLDAAYSPAYAGLGEAYWEKYRLTKQRPFLDKGKEACEHALTLDPESAEGHTCLATVHATTGDYQLAASEFQLALTFDPTDDAAYAGLASAYEHLGSMDKAEQTYKRAIALRPKNAQSYSLLGAFYHHQARYAEAAQQLKTATALAPDNSLYWAGLGGVYIEAGNYSAAIEALQKSNSIRPSAAAYSNLGQIYFILRKFEDAIAAFEQSVALGDHEIRSYGNLARAYYWFPPKRRLARATFLKAIQLAEDDLKVNPDDADAHTLASEYFAMIGNKTAALKHLNAALRLRPKDAETAYFAAVVHNQLGNRGQALSWIQKSVALGYSPAEISTTVELDSLHNDARFRSAITEVSARK